MTISEGSGSLAGEVARSEVFLVLRPGVRQRWLGRDANVGVAESFTEPATRLKSTPGWRALGLGMSPRRMMRRRARSIRASGTRTADNRAIV